MTHLSDQLRTVAARLCKSEETQVDGRMLLAFAEGVAHLECDLATIREAADDVCMALNEQLTALQALVATLQKRPTRAVDGASHAAASAPKGS